jgi:hypothetical protein
MKTPMQELIEKLDKAIGSGINTPSTWSYVDAIQSVRDIAERMLEKEKEVMCQFADDFAIECINFHHEKTMSPERFYELTYGGNNEQ